MQCTARVVAVHCGSGCSALRGRLQCTASEMGKTGTEMSVLFWTREMGGEETSLLSWVCCWHYRQGFVKKRKTAFVTLLLRENRFST